MDPLLTSCTGNRPAGGGRPTGNTQLFQRSRDLRLTAPVRLDIWPAPHSPIGAPNVRRTGQPAGRLPAHFLAFVDRCIARTLQLAERFLPRNRSMPTPRKPLLAGSTVLDLFADLVQFLSARSARCDPPVVTRNTSYTKPRTLLLFTSEAPLHSDLRPRSAELYGPFASPHCWPHSLGGAENVDSL